jgi:hypothetical protein
MASSEAAALISFRTSLRTGDRTCDSCTGEVPLYMSRRHIVGRVFFQGVSLGNGESQEWTSGLSSHGKLTVTPVVNKASAQYLPGLFVAVSTIGISRTVCVIRCKHG